MNALALPLLPNTPPLDPGAVVVWADLTGRVWAQLLAHAAVQINAGGGSSFNPAVPGPIGATTPNTIAATDITAQTVTIGGGVEITKVLTGSLALGAGTIAGGGQQTYDISVPGVVAGDVAYVSLSGPFNTGLVISAVIAGTDIVTVAVYNADLMTAIAPGVTAYAMAFKTA